MQFSFLIQTDIQQDKNCTLQLFLNLNIQLSYFETDRRTNPSSFNNVRTSIIKLI